MDRCYQKVLRLPVKEEDFILDKIFDLKCDLIEKYPLCFQSDKPNNFQIIYANNIIFLDYILKTEKNYIKRNTKIRELYDSEKVKYYPIFKKILKDIDMNKVHLVEYSCYDFKHPFVAYNIKQDDFYEEV